MGVREPWRSIIIACPYIVFAVVIGVAFGYGFATGPEFLCP